MPWLASNWLYRKLHIVNSATGAGTGYPVGIKVYYGSGTDGIETYTGVQFGKIYCGSKCKTDFSDIRFTENDGNTQLSYWMEDKVDSNYAIFWVKITDNISSSATSIYVYYGNSAASTTSNGANTFSLFDHFDDESVDATLWDINNDGWGGVGVISETGTELMLKVLSGTSYSKINISSKSTFGPNVALRSKMKFTPEVSGNQYGFQGLMQGGTDEVDNVLPDYNEQCVMFGPFSGDAYHWTNDTPDSGYNGPLTEPTYGTYQIMELTLTSGERSELLYDGSSISTRTGTTVPQVALKVVHDVSQYVPTPAQDFVEYLDWTLVRKYVYPEPTHGAWGNEENEADWFNVSWLYRKSHIVQPKSGASTGYHVGVKVHYGSGTDGSESHSYSPAGSEIVGKVYCNSKCKTDFGDIRFTSSDGTTELSYWMEQKVDSDYALFWVKVTEDLDTLQRIIWMYYGNSGASTTSNGANTFLAFDDFSGDLSNWNGNGLAYASIVDGKLIFQIPANGGVKNIYHNQEVQGNVKARWRVKYSDWVNNVHPPYYAEGLFDSDRGGWVLNGTYYSSGLRYWTFDVFDSGGSISYNSNFTTANMHDSYIEFWNDLSIEYTKGIPSGRSAGPVAYDRVQQPNPPMVVGFRAQASSIYPATIECEYFYVRRWVYPSEPVHTEWGAEEEVPVSLPTVTTSAVTSIAKTTATLNGNITDDGQGTLSERGFDIGTETGVYTDEEKEVGSFSTGVFSLPKTGLVGDTTYYVRAKCRNEVGWAYGSEVSFTTLAEPTVITNAVTNKTTTFVTLNGNITDINQASVTERGFDVGKISGIYDYDVTVTGTFGTGTFSISLDGLLDGETYFIRAKAQNSVGWGYGIEISFTMDEAIEVSTQRKVMLKHTRTCPECGGDMFMSPLYENISGNKFVIWRCESCSYERQVPVNPKAEP